VKANNLQDKTDIHVDATLAKMFEAPLNGPQIMKQLSRHMVEKIEGSSLKGRMLGSSACRSQASIGAGFPFSQ
jgi:hypothetical protein